MEEIAMPAPANRPPQPRRAGEPRAPGAAAIDKTLETLARQMRATQAAPARWALTPAMLRSLDASGAQTRSAFADADPEAALKHVLSITRQAQTA
jgi:hypothetical protein